jgi:hypothetical protein
MQIPEQMSAFQPDSVLTDTHSLYTVTVFKVNALAVQKISFLGC